MHSEVFSQIRKGLVALFFAAVACLAVDSAPKPKVVGPVSQYGKLLAGRINGQGRIFGSCEGIKPGKEVQLRGMSLYWSILTRSTEFYSEAAITQMVKDLKIQIIRIAMTVTEDWGDGLSGYLFAPEQQLALVKQAVDAAVANDIYVIIDWHSHSAVKQYKAAAAFFEKMAKEYGKLDHVIFEVFNEPDVQDWRQIKSYTELMLQSIRPYSDNLVLVANPKWDQHPEAAIGNEPKDSKNNFAYTFHFYANSHKVNGEEGEAALKALEAGLPLFVSEWGASDYDGKESPNPEAVDEWMAFLDKYKISSLNWSASKVTEQTSSAFLANSDEKHLYLSESGKLVQKKLSANPSTYKKCKH